MIARTLAELGLKRGYVVHGLDGLDEITTTGETVLLEIQGGAIADHTVGPGDFGVPTVRLEDLRGGDRDENAMIAREVLHGVKGVRRDVVLVNAAAALVAAGRAADFMQGMAVAAASVDSGAALRKLDQLVSFSSLATAGHG